MSGESIDGAARIERWERSIEWPLTVAAVLFLAAYAVPILFPASTPLLLDICQWLSWSIWALFVVDFAVRLFFAPQRLHYLVHHWYDVLVIALPLLRPLRLLRLIALLSLVNRRARTRLRGRVAVYVAGGVSLLAFCAALSVLDAERAIPEANIVDFGDAMWWAVTTMTTVGYGDRYPVTGLGRLVAAGLMVGGIALLGTVTAMIASWLVEAVAAEKEQAQDLQVMMKHLEAKVDRLAVGRDPSSERGNAGGPEGEPPTR